MVNVKSEALERDIKITKFRIKHHEKHGNGSVAMEDKARLQKQERIKNKRKDRGIL